MFQKGISGNPKGRPKRQVEEDYLKALTASVSKKDWQLICERAVRDAIKGDDKARKWLADYLIGEPEHNVNLNGKMVVEVKRIQKHG